jgi:hypothetical protein
MKKIFLPLMVLFFLVASVASANNEGGAVSNNPEKTTASAAVCSLQGKVTDMLSGETLAGVEVSVKGTDYKTFTDLDGNFSISNIVAGEYTIICSLISYNKSLVEDLKVKPTEKEQVIIKLEASR